MQNFEYLERSQCHRDRPRHTNDAEHYDFKLVIEHSRVCAGGRKGEDDSCEISQLKI